MRLSSAQSEGQALSLVGSGLNPRDADGTADEVMARTVYTPTKPPPISHTELERYPRTPTQRDTPEDTYLLSGASCAASVDNDATVALATAPTYSVSARIAIRRAESIVQAAAKARLEKRGVAREERRTVSTVSQPDAVAHHRAADVGRHDHLRYGPVAALLHPRQARSGSRIEGAREPQRRTSC